MATEQGFVFEGLDETSSFDDTGSFNVDELNIDANDLELDDSEDEEDTGEGEESIDDSVDNDDDDDDASEEDADEDQSDQSDDEDSNQEDEEDNTEDLSVALEVLKTMGFAKALEGENAPKTMAEVEAFVENGQMAVYQSLRKNIGGAAGEILDLAIELKGKVSDQKISEALARTFDQIKTDGAVDSDPKRINYLREVYKNRKLSDGDALALIEAAKNNGTLAAKVQEIQAAERKEREISNAETAAARQRKVLDVIESADWKSDHKKQVLKSFSEGLTSKRLNAVLRNPSGLAQLASLLEEVDDEGNFTGSATKRTPKQTGKTVSNIRKAIRSRGKGKTSKSKRDVITRGNEVDFDIT